MAVKLEKWIEDEFSHVKEKSVQWLSQYYFHRVEMRPKPIDSTKFFTPADGVITSSFEKINARNPIIDAKGRSLSIRDLLQEDVSGNYLVIGVFMTFYSQHQNYIPFPGLRTYYEAPPLQTFNKPMLQMEKGLLEGVINPEFQYDYLKKNGREISVIYAPKLDQEYYLVRIGDYDIDSMVNWTQPSGKTTTPYQQNDRFGMITYGSSTFLIAKQYKNGPTFKLRKEAEVGNYVKCCYDALVNVE